MATDALRSLFGAADPHATFGNAMPRISRMAAWLRERSSPDAPWIDAQLAAIKRAEIRGGHISPEQADEYPRPIALAFQAELEARIATVLEREAAA